MSAQTEKKWIRPTKANLYHKDRLVGVIRDITVEDMFQWSGFVELTPDAARFQEMFEYFNDEKNQREPEEPDESDLPFDETLLDDWFLEDENGRREISYPVIDLSNNEIFWRD